MMEDSRKIHYSDEEIAEIDKTIPTAITVPLLRPVLLERLSEEQKQQLEEVMTLSPYEELLDNFFCIERHLENGRFFPEEGKVDREKIHDELRKLLTAALPSFDIFKFKSEERAIQKQLFCAELSMFLTNTRAEGLQNGNEEDLEWLISNPNMTVLLQEMFQVLIKRFEHLTDSSCLLAVAKAARYFEHINRES